LPSKKTALIKGRMGGILYLSDLADLPEDVVEDLSNAAESGMLGAGGGCDGPGWMTERLANMKDDETESPDVQASRQTGRLDQLAVRLQAKKDDGNDAEGPGTNVVTRTKPKTKRPSLYRVLLLNDDYTPMEFVVLVLERFFGKSREVATQIMLHVHHHGVGECGIFTYEVAETKVTQVMDFARKHQHPLQCVMEKK
jgi:ATP-dependent Clp protease adaptor protein ClpS